MDEAEKEEVLSVDVISTAHGSVVTVAGELDPHTAGELQATLEEVLMPDGVSRVVLELSGVRFIDSSGLRVLLAANESLMRAGGRLTLRAPSAAVMRLLEITDLVDRLDVE